MNRPASHILKDTADLKLWQEAERQALRSHLKAHRTGAVIFDKRGRILSTGCSHIGPNKSRWTHAEEHACSRMWPALETLSAHCIIVTVNKNGHWACSSRPCAMCINMLNHYNIQYATYAEKCNDGSWEVNQIIIPDMMDRVKEIDITAQYAKHMRI